MKVIAVIKGPSQAACENLADGGFARSGNTHQDNHHYASIGIIVVTLFIEDIRELDVPPLGLHRLPADRTGLAGLVFRFESIGRGISAAMVTAIMLGGLCIAL
jgi:hypothetical protein